MSTSKILFAVSIKATRQLVAEKARRYLISSNYNRYDLLLLYEATYPRAKVLPPARLPRYTLGGFFFFCTAAAFSLHKQRLQSGVCTDQRDKSIQEQSGCSARPRLLTTPGSLIRNASSSAGARCLGAFVWGRGNRGSDSSLSVLFLACYVFWQPR